MTMAKARGDDATGDLFHGESLFPVVRPVDMPRALDLKRQISVSMMEAVRASGKTIPVIAMEMSELLGDEEVTGQQLYAYTSQSKVSHTISIVRWIAFVRATGAPWLWADIVRDEGLVVFSGEDALHAQASLARKQGQALLERAKRLEAAAPMQVRMPRGRRK
jgi:hypothetical protein